MAKVGRDGRVEENKQGTSHAKPQEQGLLLDID